MTSDPVARYLSTRGSKLGQRTRLRLMTSSEVLDTALRAYRLMGSTFLKLTITPTLLCLASVAFVEQYLVPALTTTQNANNVNAQLGETLVALLIGLFIGGPLFLMGTAYTSALVVQLVSDFMVGNTVDASRAMETARSTMGRMLMLTFREVLLALSGVGVSLGFMMLGGFLTTKTAETDATAAIVSVIGILGLVVGGLIFLWVISVHALSPAVCVIERVGSKAAAKRSKELLKSYKFHPSGTSTVWSVYIVMGFAALAEGLGLLIVFGAFDIEGHLKSILAGVPFQGVLLAMFDLIPSFLVLWTIIPVWAVTITIIYYERRIRLEGYDIEALAADIGKDHRTNRFQL